MLKTQSLTVCVGTLHSGEAHPNIMHYNDVETREVS